MVKLAFSRLSLLPLVFVLGLPLTQCNVENCEKKRDELTVLKRRWEQCSTSADCMIIGGNSADCSGVLACNLAINRIYRDEAERRIQSLPEETTDCVRCTPSNCAEGDIAICEPVSHECEIVKAIIDGGAQIVLTPPDTNPPPPPPDLGGAGAPNDLGI